MAKYARFGELMTEGTDKLAASYPYTKKVAVFDKLAEDLGHTGNAMIYQWRTGKRLPKSDQLAILADIFVNRWNADKVWIEAFLRAGRTL